MAKSAAASWLSVTSLSCDDLAALAALRQLSADFGSARFRIHANVFNAPASGAPSTSSCATLDALRAAEEAGALHLAAVTTVSGYKTSCWRSLVPALTASYNYVWLRDSDVYADPHLFSLREVEFWMAKAGAAVAQPTILPLDGRSKSHGWWTPFRSAFHGGCLAQSTPIVEQMTPIFERAAFDAFRQKLASVPQELLRTDSGDFGLETFWCGLLKGGCALINHVSVVHADTRTIKRHASKWQAPAASSSSSHVPMLRNHANASSSSAGAGSSSYYNTSAGLRNYLIARWPNVMNVSGHPGDVHHRLHRTRCFGVAPPAAANVTNTVRPRGRS